MYYLHGGNRDLSVPKHTPKFSCLCWKREASKEIVVVKARYFEGIKKLFFNPKFIRQHSASLLTPIAELIYGKDCLRKNYSCP